MLLAAVLFLISAAGAGLVDTLGLLIVFRVIGRARDHGRDLRDRTDERQRRTCPARSPRLPATWPLPSFLVGAASEKPPAAYRAIGFSCR
jgi:hypothetical protein